MAAGNDQTKRSKSPEEAEEKQPPGNSVGNEVDAATIAESEDSYTDFDEEVNIQAAQTEAAIRAGISLSPIELEALVANLTYGPQDTLQPSKSVELSTKPLSFEETKLLNDGRQKFFEPGLDERSRLIALRDSYDAIAASRGAASSRDIIREGRTLLGLSNYLTLSDALTSVDGGRSQDPQRQAQAAQRATVALEEIRRLSSATPPGSSAPELQRLLGGKPGVDELLRGLASQDPAERDKALSALAKAVSGGNEWSADNMLTRAFHEKSQETNASQSDKFLRLAPNVQLLDTHSPTVTPVRVRTGDESELQLAQNAYVAALSSLQDQQRESRRALVRDGSLNGRGEFQLSLNGNVTKPDSLADRVSSVLPYMLNAQVMLPTPGSQGDLFLGRQDIIGNLLRPQSGLLLGNPGRLQLDGRQALLGRDSIGFPFDAFSTRQMEPTAPPWLQTAECVRDLSSANNLLEATSALRNLETLAQSGDLHARAALATALVALTNGEAGHSLAQKSIASSSPVFCPDFSRLDAKTRETLKEMVVSEFTGSGLLLNMAVRGDRLFQTNIAREQAGQASDVKLPLANLTSNELTCLAIAVGAGRTSTATESQRANMKAILEQHAGTDTGAYAIMNVLGALGDQRSDVLEQMLVSNLTGRRGDYFLDFISPSALKGDEKAIGILARTVGRDGMEPEKAQRAYDALMQAAHNGHGDLVVKALLEQNAKYGDDGNVLNCLGAIAQQQKISYEKQDEIADVLRKGIASGDPDTHESAIKGFLNLSSRWSAADLQLIADNVCETTAEGLKGVINIDSPATAKLLANRITDNLQSGAYSHIRNQTGAVTALGVLADYAPVLAAATIKDALSVQRFVGNADADKLTISGVNALMRMAGSRGAASEIALDALREPGFRNTANLKLEQASVRSELANFVSGSITREEMSPETRAATFDSQFPISLQGILREHGISSSRANELVEQARNNYDDGTIRAVIDRVELFNTLPPPLRARILGENGEVNNVETQGASQAGNQSGAQSGTSDAPSALLEQLDLPTVFGQMANGKLEESGNSLLLDPLETKVKNLREEIGRELRAVSEDFQLNGNRVRDSLDSLTQHTAKGITTWDHVTSTLRVSSAYHEFILNQEAKLKWFERQLRERTVFGVAIDRLNKEQEALKNALDATQYQRLRKDGKEDEADRLALSMLQTNGPDLAGIAPNVWKDLGMVQASSGETVLSNKDGETIWQRLHRQGHAKMSTPPALVMHEQGGLMHALKELSIHRGPNEADGNVRRQLAFLAMDTDPRLASFTKSASEVQAAMPDLDRLLRAGLQGTRGTVFVNDVRTKVGVLEATITKMNTEDEFKSTPLQRMKEDVRRLRDSFPNIDPAAQDAVLQRIEAFEKVIEVFDANSQANKNVRLLIEKVKSNDFDDSGFLQWLEGDGIKTVAAVTVAVAAAAFAVATFGTGTPLALAAVAAASTAGGMLGYELAAEGLHFLGGEDRTGSQLGHYLRGGLVDGENGNAREITFGDVATDYGSQFVKGMIFTVATMGAGAAMGKGLSAVSKVFSRTATAETQALARLCARAAQLESAAEKLGGQELRKRWVDRLSQQFRTELGGELKEELIYEESAGVLVEQFIGEANPALSIFTSALIANRKGLAGFDLHPKGGGAIELELDNNTGSVETMSKLRDQMLTDGLQVEWNGQADSPMTVKTPEGYTIKVTPRTSAEIADTARVQATSAEQAQDQTAGNNGNLSLNKLSTGSTVAPRVETDNKAVRLGQLEMSLEQEGHALTLEQKSAKAAEVEKLKREILTDLRNEAAIQLSRATGINPDAARSIVEGLNINLKPYDALNSRAGSFKNSDGSLTLYAGGDMPGSARPHKTFVHEFTHAIDAARYTALLAANPNGFVNSLVDNVMSNSFTGKVGIWDNSSARISSDMLYTRMRAGEHGLTNEDIAFAKEQLSNFMRQHAAEGRLPETPTQETLAAWIKEQGGKFPDSNQEATLLGEMVREISHANTVLAESQLGADAMTNPAVQQMVQAFANSQSADPVVLNHLMRGVSDATTALADSSQYEFGSRYENRANRLQARSTIEATQSAMPELTSDLQAAIKNKPEFAALNAKLQTLLGAADGTSNRREGVRQSEYFASAEGQAELAKLMQDPHVKWVAARISQNVQTRQEALSTQRYLTALDQLPARKAQSDASTGDAAVKAEQELQSTLQSLFANGRPADMPQLTKFLGSSGLASGDQILKALTANSASALARFDNVAVSKIVQSLEANGMKRARIMEALTESGTTSPALAARLPELTAMLPPPVEIQLADLTLKEGWRSTLDSLSDFEFISRLNNQDIRTAATRDIENTVANWKPARHELDNLRLMQDHIEFASKQQAAWAATTSTGDVIGGATNPNTAPAAQLLNELTAEAAVRAEALGVSFNQTLAANNLPAVTITVAGIGNSTNAGANTPPARYNPKTGTIEVSPELLLTATRGTVSDAVSSEYEKALAHSAAANIAANQNSSQPEIDAANRVSEMFAVQAASQAKVEELSQRAEMLADNTRLILSEPGVESLMKRMSSPGANVEAILGIVPPPELSALITKFQQAQKRNGTTDRNKWPFAADQEVSQLLFSSIYKESVQARSDLQRARLDRPPTQGELAFDRANFDNEIIDAAAATNFSIDYGSQADQRTLIAQNHSWAIADRASLSALSDFAGKAGIVEIGAGKGIWAEKLRLMGVNVSAYDIFAGSTQENIYHQGQHKVGVQEGGVEKAGSHSAQTLFLSYPTPNESMGADALKAYTAAGGTRLAFIGDRPAPGSDFYNTGDQEFHQMLDNDWVLKEVVEMPHLPDGYTISAAKMYLYERRGTTSQTADANVDTNTTVDLRLKESKRSDGTGRPEITYMDNRVSTSILQHEHNYKPVQFVTTDGKVHTGSSLFKVVGEVEKGKFESGLFVDLEGTPLAAPKSGPALDDLAAIPGTRGFYRDHGGYVWKVEPGKSPEFQPEMAVITESNIHNPLSDSVSSNAAKMKELNNRELTPDQFREQLLSVINNSPLLDYSPDSLIELNSRQRQYLNAINHPIGGSDFEIISSNCKDCVAAIYRTMHEGRIVRAADVAETIGPNGKPIGHLGPIEFEDHSDSALSAAKSKQMEWLAQAAGTETLKPVSLDQLASVANLTGASEFVVVVKINSDVDHVIYGNKQPDGSMTYYDPQSGVRWSPQSIERANPTYYPMVARTQAEGVNPEAASIGAARPVLEKESKRQRNQDSSSDLQDRAGEEHAAIDELNSQIEKAAPELKRSLKLLAKFAGDKADNLAVIEHLLKMDSANHPQDLKQFLDPELIKVMKGGIFGHIRPRLHMESGILNSVSEVDNSTEAQSVSTERQPKGKDVSDVLSGIDPSSNENFQYHDLDDYAKTLAKSNIKVAEFLGVGYESVAFRTPDGNVLKITRTDELPGGEWNPDWGQRSFDAPILGEVDILDGESKEIAVYKQPFASSEEISTNSPEWREFRRKMKDEGQDFWDGDFAGDQVGMITERGRRRVVLIDYPSVRPGGG